jgi:biotin carboxyl carrier protein
VPKYNILIENRPYKVILSKKEDKGVFEARVNDKLVEVKLGKSEVSSTSPLTLEVAGKTYKIELEKLERRTPFNLKVNNVLFKAQLREPAKKVSAPQISTHKAAAKVEIQRGTIAEEGAVVAPMAGKIVSVKVKEGEAVKAGDVVCVLEAMKMENEITAVKTGKVQEVNVVEGTPVNDGDVLVIIK